MQPTISTCCLFIGLLLSAAIFSQQDNLIVLRPGPAEAPSKKIFIRLYNEQGRRIGKGHLLYGNDTVIMLRKRRSIHKYHVLTVTFIKTRRHRVRDLAIGTGVVLHLLPFRGPPQIRRILLFLSRCWVHLPAWLQV